MDHRISRAIRFIETNYSRKVSLGDLSKCANLSESHFLHLFKMETRLSPAKVLGEAVKKAAVKKAVAKKSISRSTPKKKSSRAHR